LSETAGGRKGRLYLLPTLLGPAEPEASLPPQVQSLACRLDALVAESAKSARHFLKAIGHPGPLTAVSIAELNEHTPASALPALLAPAKAGGHVGLLSEAGCPAVADPGANLVALAHAEGVPVVPLVGPSSLLLALMASGLNGQHFCFHGYLPVERSAREAAIRALEAQSLREGSAQLLIEAPYRNNRLLEALLHVCRSDTRLCLAVDLTLSTESIATRRVSDWRDNAPDIDRRPAVFILQA
jgi:16S rRNA (cytidine1402-2'-O)-methyltransferase